MKKHRSESDAFFCWGRLCCCHTAMFVIPVKRGAEDVVLYRSSKKKRLPMREASHFCVVLRTWLMPPQWREPLRSQQLPQPLPS